jgi:hypothetical protein
MAFGSDWVGVGGRVLLNTSIFYSVKDFENTVVLQWLTRKLSFGEVTFAVQRLYCKASVNYNVTYLLRLSVWRLCSAALPASLFISACFVSSAQVQD